MVSASVPALGFCFEFLPWLPSVDCDPGYVSQINLSLPKSLLVMVLFTPAKSKLRQCLFLLTQILVASRREVSPLQSSPLEWRLCVYWLRKCMGLISLEACTQPRQVDIPDPRSAPVGAGGCFLAGFFPMRACCSHLPKYP